MVLASNGLKTALIEKNSQPGGKTCGDGLTPDVFRQLQKIDPLLAEKVCRSTDLNTYKNLLLQAPNGKQVVVNIPASAPFPGMAGMRRSHFDRLLFNHLLNNHPVSLHMDCRVNSLVVGDTAVTLHTSSGSVSASLVVGADGANSVAARFLPASKTPQPEKAFAIRGYYQFNDPVRAATDTPVVVFDKSLLPGYLWIFPLNDGWANIGLGIDSHHMAKNNVNLKAMLNKVLPRVVESLPYGQLSNQPTIRGHFIPLGRAGNPISGNRILLAGDAASLAHPLTGEGIGNAIRSGRLAAAQAISCFRQNKFDAAFNRQYDHEIYRITAGEFRNFRMLQSVFRFPAALNFLAAAASPALINRLTDPERIASLQNKRFLLPKLLWEMAFHR